MSATGKVAQIADALLARAALLAVGSPALPVAMPGVSFTPPDGAYIEVNFFASPPKWEGVASGVIDQGRLVVGIIWPKKLPGIIGPLEAAEAVRAHFPKGLQLTSGATTVKVALEPYAGSPIQLPDRSVTAITIPWVA